MASPTRFLLCAWLACSGVLGFADAALAQTITLRNANSSICFTSTCECTYTNLSLNGSGAVVVDCATSNQPAPGSVSFASAGTTVLDNVGAVAVTVVRFGNTGTAAQASVPYSCSASQGYAPGYSPASSGSLSFSGNEQKSFSITPTTLPAGMSSAVVTCTLGTPTGAAAAGPTTFTLNVTSSGGGGGGGGGTCSSFPVTQSLIHQGAPLEKFEFRYLKSGETASIRFPASRVLDAGLSSQVVLTLAMPLPGGGPAPDGWEMVLSECEGNFTQVPVGNLLASGNCGYYSTSIYGSITGKTVAAGPAECQLDPNKNYFLNIRWRDPGANQATCASTGGCGAYMKIWYAR